MSDSFQGFANGLSTPAVDGVAVTPSDSTVLPTTKGLYVGVTGSVVVTMANGTVLTFASVPAGTILPLRVTKVMAATGASSIVALI